MRKIIRAGTVVNASESVQADVLSGIEDDDVGVGAAAKPGHGRFVRRAPFDASRV